MPATPPSVEIKIGQVWRAYGSFLDKIVHGYEPNDTVRMISYSNGVARFTRAQRDRFTSQIRPGHYTFVRDAP